MIRTLTKRPIGVLSATLLLLALGALALTRLPIGLMPDAKRPVLIVEVDASGQSSHELEETVITPLRNSLRQLESLEQFRTYAFPGGGRIWMTFSWTANLEDLYLQANEAIDRSRSALPPDLPRPNVLPPGSGDIPVAQIAISSPRHTLVELSEWATFEGARRLEQLESVARCEIVGQQEPGFGFLPSATAIESANLTLTDVCQQIRNATGLHLSFSGGSGVYDLPVSISTHLHSLDALRGLHIQTPEGLPVALGDLGSLEDIALPMRDMILDGQQEALLLQVFERGGANLIDLRDELDQTLEDIVKEHPDFEFRVVDNQSQWVLWSLSGLGQSVMYGAAFAIILLFLVIRSWRAPILMALTVPSALLLSGLGFYFLDMSLNLMSITGLALGVGVLVDNGIIVVENIQRYRQQGLPGGLAVVKGSREMAGPLLASSATTLSMFAPLWLASGMTGVLFRDMALAVAISLVSSLLVALLLIPVLDKVLPAGQIASPKPEIRGANKSFHLSGGTRNVLAFGAVASLAGIALLSFSYLPLSVFPDMPIQEATLHLTWEPGTSLQENLRRSQELAAMLPPECTNLLCMAGPSSQIHSGSLEDVILRFSANSDVLSTLPALISGWISRQAPHASWDLDMPPNTLTQWTGSLMEAPELFLVPVEAGRMDSLHDVAPLFAEMQQHPAVNGVQLPWSATRPEWHIFPKSPSPGNPGIDPGSLMADWSLYHGQQIVSRWQETDQQHSLMLPGSSLPLPQAIETQTLKGLALSELVDRELSTTPAYRVGNDARAFHLVRLQTPNGKLPEEALDTWQDMALAAGWLLLPDPAIQETKDRQQELLGLFGIGILLLTVILIAQFESFRLPLVVLSTIPFGIGGSLLLLLLTGAGLNLMSGMGIIIVSGIVVNDAILKVETIRRNREAGMAMPEAIRQAGQQRFRAIFLTSATTILAMWPVLFTDGPGGAMQTPLALAVIGGMVAGTLAAIWWVGWLMGKVA